MTIGLTIRQLPAHAPVAPVPRPVLVVDDSRAQRKILQMQLTRWGYDVTEAASGDEALVLCQSRNFDMVLSDWMMPGMSGLEFCKAFRQLPREGYGYFILLTSKSEKTEVAVGLENGADDFLSKPVSADELRARLRAGERILGMQDELVEKNRLVGSTLGELQKLYDSLDRDLIEANKLQQALVRNRQLEFLPGSASVLMRPSGHVGGDLVGTFQITTNTVVIYSVDVAGHGIASAMMTARLAALFSGGAPDQNIALSIGAYGRRNSLPPEMVAHRLNRMMTEGISVDQYFTMAYAEIDLLSGRVQLVQAGHPHPLIMRADGSVQVIGQGGLPIGLIEGCQYERVTFNLQPGDRLFLMSDGLTECPNPDGTELGTEGLIGLINKSRALNSTAMLEALIWDLTDYAQTSAFPDDVSGIVFDYRGPP